MSTLQSKWCPKCRQEKPADDFYKDPGRVDGLRGYCIVCMLDYLHQTGYRGQYKYTRAHREHYTELERLRYHRIQDEAGCHSRVRDFFPGYRLLQALVNAEVVEA